MKRKVVVFLVGIAFGSLTLIATASAQRVRDLTGHELTSERLQQVLKPKGPVPRGVGLKPPECTHFRKAASRGIALAPKADIAAISVEFDTNSAELKPEAKENLDKLGAALSSAGLKPCCFEIEGYTDAVGGSDYNKKLSEERAQSVIDYLAEHSGVEKDRMMPKGFGKTHFIASNATESGRQKNRRVQIVNLGYGTTPAE